jgi:hypothetical protein
VTDAVFVMTASRACVCSCEHCCSFVIAHNSSIAVELLMCYTDYYAHSLAAAAAAAAGTLKVVALAYTKS